MILFLVLKVLVIAGIFFIVWLVQSIVKKRNSPDVVATPIEQTAVFNSNSASVATVKTEEEKTTPTETLPSKFLLDVQFQSQAPFGDWSQPYQDACEEAAIIIVEHYFNQQSLSKEVMKSEIDSSVVWQIKNWGGHHDLPADQILKLAEDYYNLTGKVVRDYSLNDMKVLIHSGKPILAPTAGRKLGNPNFSGAGPEYHNIVIIGYDDLRGVFITNDPGTRKGENYIYKYQTVLSAISGPQEDMKKEVIVIKE